MKPKEIEIKVGWVKKGLEMVWTVGSTMREEVTNLDDLLAGSKAGTVSCHINNVPS